MSEEIKTKKCSICKEVKPFVSFHKKIDGKYGLKSLCKKCVKIQSKIYYDNNKEAQREKGRNTYLNNKESILKDRSEYYKNNRNKILGQKKDYWIKNKEKISKKSAKYRKTKMETDLEFRLVKKLKTRIIIAIKKQYSKKAYSSIELLGCTPKEARIHLEKQFTKGMTWENHGKWEIDHRIPCASFDLTNPDEQKTCFSYLNLQPLWKKDNRSKSDKILYLI